MQGPPCSGVYKHIYVAPVQGSAPCPGDNSYIRSLWNLSSMMQKRPTTTGVGGRGRSPLIRAPAPRPCPCRRPSVVTEGYIRLPPLPPTHLVSIPVHPVFTIIVVIYSVFCVWCSKNIVFYRVLWPSPSPDFISATLKNHGFFMVLGLRKGSGTENWTS